MILINDKADVCQTLKANYYKTSLANFVRGGRAFQHRELSSAKKMVTSHTRKWNG